MHEHRVVEGEPGIFPPGPRASLRALQQWWRARKDRPATPPDQGVNSPEQDDS